MPGDGNGAGRAQVDAVPLRLRFAAFAVIIAALPVAVGGWALARQVSANQAQNADVMLQPELRRAAAHFTMEVGDANAQAERLAGNSPLVDALERRDTDAVRRVLAGSRDIAVLLPGGGPVVGEYPKRAATATVEVVPESRSVGTVVVSVPVDATLLEELRKAGNVAPPDQIAVAGAHYAVGGPRGLAQFTGTPERPRNVRIGGAVYRTLGAHVRGMRVLVLRPRKAIDAAISHSKKRIYGGALALLAAVGLLAYFLAPLLARGRLTQQQRAQAARVLSEVGDGVFLLDRSRQIRFWNPAAEAITGLSAADVLGQPIDAVLPAWRDVEPRISVARSDNGSERPGVSTLPVEVGGRELWLSFSGADFAEGRVYTFRDLSEDRRIEQLKMDFVATVSHELRTPLSAISGASVTLRERGDALPEGTREQLLAMISEQSDRLTIMIDDILTAGQLAYGRLAVANEGFDPVQLVRSVVADVGAALVDGHVIELHAAGEVPRSSGDASKARQVLTNLLENAAKYSPGGGRIDVRVEAAERGVRFSVSDEGLGIPKREQERVFEKFYRVDPLMKGGISGTGLGLYICRELVQHMGGRIWVESTPGVGSTFTFELPFAPGEARRRLGSTPPSEEPAPVHSSP